MSHVELVDRIRALRRSCVSQFLQATEFDDHKSARYQYLGVLQRSFAR